MRRRFVVSLDDPLARDVAAGLGTLVAAGFPAPGYGLFRTAILNGRRCLTPVASQHRPGDLRLRRQAMTDLNRRLLQEHGLTAWDHWGPEVIAVTERLAARDLQALDGAGLAEHLEDAFGAFRRA